MPLDLKVKHNQNSGYQEVELVQAEQQWSAFLQGARGVE